MIFQARETVNALYTKDRTIAVRLVDGWLGQAIAATGPVTATSVNRSGGKALLIAKDIISEFHDECKYLLWGNSGNNPSKIIDISHGEITILRA